LFFVVKNNTNKEREENRSEFFKEEAERGDDKIRFCHRKREERKKKGNTRRGKL